MPNFVNMEKNTNHTRLTQLKQMLQEEPNDPFLIYAIATEYLNIDSQQARHYFEQLLEKHEDYIATYYHAAHLYAALEEEDLAKQTYEKGIEKAKAQQETKTLQELQNAYQNYLFEIDED